MRKGWKGKMAKEHGEEKWKGERGREGGASVCRWKVNNDGIEGEKEESRVEKGDVSE
jgi:hypothetical protein